MAQKFSRLTLIAMVGGVLRDAPRVRANPSASLVGLEPLTSGTDPARSDPVDHPASLPVGPDPRLRGTQRWALAISACALGLMIFSVVFWSSLTGGTTGPADYGALPFSPEPQVPFASPSMRPMQ